MRVQDRTLQPILHCYLHTDPLGCCLRHHAGRKGPYVLIHRGPFLHYNVVYTTVYWACVYKVTTVFRNSLLADMVRSIYVS